MSAGDEELERELAGVLNRHSRENMSGTPDVVLARYLVGCLRVWEENVMRRDEWWRFTPRIGGTVPAVDTCEYCDHPRAVHEKASGGCLRIVDGERCACGRGASGE